MTFAPSNIPPRVPNSATVPTLVSTSELVDAVRMRRSTRTFEPVPLQPEHAAFIQAYLSDPGRMVGPFGGRARIELVELGHGDGLRDREIGTYGYVKGYPSVLVAIARNQPRALVELAEVTHGLVLQLTRIGVASVWLGAAFNRADVQELLTLEPGELIGAMIPIGYATDKRLKERILRFAIRSDNRKPMDVTYCFGDFNTPLGTHGGLFRTPLELARRAPSAKNKQSWRVVVARDLSRLDIYAAFSLRHQVGVGRKMYACPPEYLDLGTYLKTLEVGLASEGLAGEFVIDDPGLTSKPDADLAYIASYRRH